MERAQTLRSALLHGAGWTVRVKTEASRRTRFKGARMTLSRDFAQTPFPHLVRFSQQAHGICVPVPQGHSQTGSLILGFMRNQNGKDIRAKRPLTQQPEQLHPSLSPRGVSCNSQPVLHLAPCCSKTPRNTRQARTGFMSPFFCHANDAAYRKNEASGLLTA